MPLGFQAAVLPHGGRVPELSREDGSLPDPTLPARMITRYPWHLRGGEAQAIVDHMTQRGQPPNASPDSPPNSPHVLALWDAIGIAHELNGYRNDAAGWIKKYGDERELQISALNDYDGLKAAMSTRAGLQQKQTQDTQLAHTANQYDPKEMALRRTNAAKLPEPQRSQQLQLCNIVDGWAQRGLRQIGFEGRLNAANSYPEPRRTQEIKVVQADAERSLQKRSDAAQDNIDRVEAGAWPPYQARIAKTADKFRENQYAFNKRAGDLIDQRTPALIQWLEAKLFLDTLGDFDGHTIDDGILFDEVVGEALFGLGSCKAGTAKIDAWVNECKATIESNLLWRVIALNQTDARKELDTILADARAHHRDQTLATTVAWVGYTAKSAKALADTYKKAQGVFDANEKAKDPKAKPVFGANLQPVRTLGTDQVAITAGDRIFKAFRIDKLGDYASEKIIQYIFSLRAFVPSMYAVDLIVKQAPLDGIDLAQLNRRIDAGVVMTKLPGNAAARAEQVEELKTAWKNFKAADAGGAGMRAVKDARLAIVVGLIEFVNFSKLLADCKTKGDKKSYFSLLASGMSIASALLDVAAVAGKNLPKLGAESLTYQAFKGAGGVLSGGASLIGAWLDFVDADKAQGQGYEALAYLYQIKLGAGLTSGVLTLAISYSYAAGAIGRLTNTAVKTIAKDTVLTIVGKRAAAIVGLRILGMALGSWLTLGSFGVQVIIWIVTPDALEKWIDHSAFGTKRDAGGYKTAQEQEDRLKDALVEMGFAQ